MDTLDDETVVVPVHGDDALHSQDIRPEIRSDVLDLRDELLRVERPVGGEGQAADALVVLVSVFFGEKRRFDVKNAVEAEGVAAQHFAEIDIAAPRAMQVRIGVDPPKARLDRGKLVSGDKVGLVEQNDVGECDLLLRLRRPIDLLRKVLRVGQGDDGDELGLAANVLVDCPRSCPYQPSQPWRSLEP